MEKKHLVTTLNIALESLQSNIHTTTIAKVTKVGDTTISCKPVINKIYNGKSIPFPEFIEVPIIYLQGADTYTIHPIKEGDYCLLFITERSFDKWWLGQDFLEPVDKRMHDYSDSFALVGIVPRDKSIKIPKDKIMSKGNLQREGNIENKGTVKSEGDVENKGKIKNEGDITIIGNCSLGKEGASKIPIVKEDLDKAIDNVIQGVSDWVKLIKVVGQASITFPPSPLIIQKPSPITTKVKVE